MKIGLQTDIPPCLPMAAGRYYFVPNSTSTTTLATLGVGTLRAVPCFIPQRINVTKIGAEVTSVGDAACVVRLGIYENDPAASRPGALVLDAGTIAGDSATVQEIAVSDITIGPGWYWFAQVVQNTTGQPTMRIPANGSAIPPIDGFANIPTAGQLAWGCYVGSVTGALPATFTPVGFASAIPRIFIKT